MKLALAMIVKGVPSEAKFLDKCLLSVREYVDDIFILVNGPDGFKVPPPLQKVFTKHAVYSEKFVWTGDFAAARNQSFKMVPLDFDWILWLDADDVVENPEEIKKTIELAKNADGIMVKYNYDHDEFGNVTTVHTNLRLVRNNGAFEWKGRIHETPIETRRVTRVRADDFTVRHTADERRKDNSNARNITIMENLLKDEGDNPDPRTMYYLGTAYIDAGRYDEAVDLLDSYLRLSGWDEERSQANVWLGRLYRDNFGDQSRAVEYFLKALYENPKEVTAFIELGAVEMQQQNWKKAILWLEQALLVKMPENTSLVMNPLENTYRTYIMLAECHLELGGRDLPLALKLAEAAVQVRPDEFTTNFVEMTKSLIKEQQTTKSFVNAVKQLPKEKALIAYEKLNPDYKKNPAVIAVMRLHVPPKKWKKNSVAIFCGPGVLKDWGPWSLETGIGGSEEAVIRLSKHLVDLGLQVTVYNECGTQDGIYDGVEYKNYWEFDGRDKFDTLVIWRAPHLLEKKFDARKVYLWMHDVMPDAEFTETRLKNVDKVMLLSKYHKTVFPSIPDEKVLYTGNGIDPDDWENPKDKTPERNPHQVCYMSSHVRGLETLLDMWPAVLKKVPDATLKICYGWESYDEVNRNNPERIAWKNMMIKKMQDLGIEDMGRIGQQDIVRLTQESGIWCYPTSFCEIYCITAVKAQAGGAWPVCTDFAALDEMVSFGDKFHMEAIDDKTPVGKWEVGDIEKFTDGLITRLQNPADDVIRQAMMDETRKNHSWRSVAEGWKAEFKS